MRKFSAVTRAAKGRVAPPPTHQDVKTRTLHHRQRLAQATKTEAQKLLREHEKFPQQGKAAKYPLIFGEDRFIFTVIRPVRYNQAAGAPRPDCRPCSGSAA